MEILLEINKSSRIYYDPTHAEHSDVVRAKKTSLAAHSRVAGAIHEHRSIPAQG
jgi:hypothetical protein